MPISIKVTNQPPKICENVFQPLKELFAAYTEKVSGKAHLPFEHQAQTFNLLMEDKEAFLVAGTAAGKTLSIAVPLFYKLQNKKIHRVLLMYPTIALMEDQRRVMDILAQLTGLEVAQIQGGMSRSKLFQALNKQVILATPDAICWFFRKNIKYSGLLIYSLALIDEFVLDEAHLFNGLMLRNFEHLWRRIELLAHEVGKLPRLHILTATPTEALKKLSRGKEIQGQSKCEDVAVEFRPCNKFDLAEQIAEAIKESLASGQRKILVVCNSARMAHQIFEKYKVDDVSRIPVEHLLEFGQTTLGALISWLEKSGFERAFIDEVSGSLLREEDIVLDDVPEGSILRLSLEDIIKHTAEILDRQCWGIKRALWEKNQQADTPLESLLSNSQLAHHILKILRQRLEDASTLEKQKDIVDEWLTFTIEKLGNISQDPIICKAKGFSELIQEFILAGLDEQTAILLIKKLVFEMKADPEQIPARKLSHRPLYLRWLSWIARKGNIENIEKLREVVKTGLASGELEVECRHIGLWNRANTPVIVYSGSMSKFAREGLIDVFADLDSAVLISTSAVEVGVDFHADLLVTVECEGLPYLQRFGRVGRHGKNSRVITFVNGDTYSSLSFLDQTLISRQDFSNKIVEIFPSHNYAVSSQWLDAHHYLINEQIGIIGQRLNDLNPDLANARLMAEELRSSSIQLSFGLRGTMPQITLRDGISKDPFYLLRYVDDADLRTAESPFEVARAKQWFTTLIFRPARYDVIVNLEKTLEESEYIFILHGENLRYESKRSIGLYYLELLAKYDPWHQNQSPNILLLHGNVYLSRIDRLLRTTDTVCDREQNPLFIPDQTYLILWGWEKAAETNKLLEESGVANWEELYYDEDRLKQETNHAMVILERMTGACFAAYKELIRFVDRQT